MVEESSSPNDETSHDTTVAKAIRERSRIEFPYADLATASELAIMLQKKGDCDEGQLAAWLDQSVNGGTFRSRLSAARMFGLLKGPNKELTLTELGRRLAELRSEMDARVEAFLHVPLYRILYEKLTGYDLPPAAAIERQMVAAGVVATQSTRARQAFLKSAMYAGFNDKETGRFVKPNTTNSPSAVSERFEPIAARHGGGNGGGDNEPPYHPFILGLLKTLPAPETEWPIEDRVKWLQTAGSIFGLIYKGEGTLIIQQESAKSAS